jgi:hypothetical protein
MREWGQATRVGTGDSPVLSASYQGMPSGMP